MTHTEKKRGRLDQVGRRKLAKSGGLAAAGYMVARIAVDAGLIPEDLATPEGVAGITAAATFAVNVIRKLWQRF